MFTRAAVFLITLSGLVFEIGLTRIYSATIWYHFAFVAISMALLGWGLGGLAVHLLKKRWPPSLEKAALAGHPNSRRGACGRTAGLRGDKRPDRPLPCHPRHDQGDAPADG